MLPVSKNTFNNKIISAAFWYAAAFFALILIAYYFEINQWLASVLDLFMPVLLGLAFAYILKPIFHFFERKPFSRIYPSSLRRVLSLLCTYILFISLIILLILLIIPQLIGALISFIGDYGMYIDSAAEGINVLLGGMNRFLQNTIGKSDFFKPIDGTHVSQALYKILEGYLSQIDIQFVFSAASTFFSALTDVIFALFISLYLLSSKEKRYAQVMKFRNAMFSDKTNKRITRLCTTIDNLFGKFFEGRIFDSLIIGTLLYILFLLFGIPYAIVLSSFIAVLNIIPYIGFIIGAVPTTLLVLLSDYTKILPFLVIVVLVFQIETNILSPKILGNNTGVSSLCVIIAICVMGALFGFVGVLLGVPLFATVLDFGNSIVERRLEKKRRPSDVENYYAPDPIIDPMESNLARTNKLISRIERRALRTMRWTDLGMEANISKIDRICAAIHRFGSKQHLFNTISPEIMTQFSVGEMQKNIREKTKASFSQIKSTVMRKEEK